MIMLLSIFILASIFNRSHCINTKIELWTMVELSSESDPTSYAYSLMDATQILQTPTKDNAFETEKTLEQSWSINIGECYTYNVFSHEVNIVTIIIKIHDQTVASFTHLDDTSFMQHFCVSYDMELAPFPFVQYLSFANTKQTNDENKIYHRHRQVYTQFDGSDEICNGFKATAIYNDNLSLHFPDDDQPCDDIIDFPTQFGYCECFGRKIMINVLIEQQDSCSNICNSINDGCADHPP
eukprot:411973_1